MKRGSRYWSRSVTMSLDKALGQFERIEANLARIDKIWEELVRLIPEGIAFQTGSPEANRYEDLARAFADVLK